MHSPVQFVETIHFNHTVLYLNYKSMAGQLKEYSPVLVEL